MPWPARTRSATAICSAGVARLAEAAYWPPPVTRQDQIAPLVLAALGDIGAS